MGALCFLLWFLWKESRVLRFDFASERVSQALFPVCGLLAILGLALGMGAGFLLPGSSPARRRPYWLFVALAAVNALDPTLPPFVSVSIAFCQGALAHFWNHLP